MNQLQNYFPVVLSVMCVYSYVFVLLFFYKDIQNVCDVSLYYYLCTSIFYKDIPNVYGVSLYLYL